MLSTAEVINRTVGMLSMNANLHTPATKDLKRSLYRYRRSVYQFPEPKFLADLKIPDLVCNTIGGEKFLHFDSEDHRRILVFTTNSNLNVSLPNNNK